MLDLFCRAVASLYNSAMILGGYIGIHPSVCTSVRDHFRPLCSAYISGWILSYLAQMITSIGGRVRHNDL